MAVATAMASKAMATTVMHNPMVNARRDRSRLERGRWTSNRA